MSGSPLETFQLPRVLMGTRVPRSRAYGPTPAASRRLRSFVIPKTPKASGPQHEIVVRRRGDQDKNQQDPQPRRRAPPWLDSNLRHTSSVLGPTPGTPGTVCKQNATAPQSSSIA